MPNKTKLSDHSLTTPTDAPARPLSKDHQHLWILTILATCCGTDSQRRAFTDGYNGYPLRSGASFQMRKNHELGAEVHDLLNPTTPKVSRATEGGA